MLKHTSWILVMMTAGLSIGCGDDSGASGTGPGGSTGSGGSTGASAADPTTAGPRQGVTSGAFCSPARSVVPGRRAALRWRSARRPSAVDISLARRLGSGPGRAATSVASSRPDRRFISGYDCL